MTARSTYDISKEIQELDSNGLDRIIEAVRTRRSALSQAIKVQFMVGDPVKYTSSAKTRRGTFYPSKVIQGYVIKIMQKNVKVKIPDGTVWTVHPSFLSMDD